MERRSVVREAAERVARASSKAIEKVILELVNDTLEHALRFVSYAAVVNPKIMDRLAEATEDPSDEDILAVVEELADEVARDIDAVIYGYTPKPLQLIVLGAIATARRLGKRSWFERLTYENILHEARMRGLENIERYLVRYPKLTTRIIDWLREKLLRGADGAEH